MKYFLQRDGRTYGPYSYDDLKRYQAENRIGPNDQVRREDSQNWEPWQQVLNPAPAAVETPMPPVTPAPQPQAPAFGGFTPPASTPPAPQPGFGTNPPAFGGGGFGQPPASTPPVFGGGGFGQPPAQQPAFGQPPAEQGFGGGGFGQPQIQQPQASDVPGAFGAFGAQAFGGPPQGQQPQQGGFGAPGGFGGPQQGYGGGGAVGPMPPDMEWWLVAIIAIFTCGLFLIFWTYKEAQFVKKIDPSTQAPKFYMYGLILYIIGYVVMFAGVIIGGLAGSEVLMLVFPMLGQLVLLGGLVCIILARFKMRASINQYYTMVEPMGINLLDTAGGLLTFFFGELFFQSHFAAIAKQKKAMGHPAA